MRRAVVGDRLERQADESLGEALRVGDGRRGEHELRRRAVDRAQPAQAPHDLRRVRAEDAAIDVRLVENDVAQMMEELGPAFVARQDADVQHVGVAEHDGRVLADLRALARAACRRRRSPARRPGRRKSRSLRAWSCASALVG